MTPNAIEVLIHCHVCPDPHPRRNAPAVAAELRSLEANELIARRADNRETFSTTPRGRAHIEQLCGLAWPIQAWIAADGTVIKGDES